MNSLLVTSDSHKQNLVETFGKLYKRNILTDITLVTEDHIQINAHKIVLCAGSEFFSDFLLGSSNGNGSNTLMFLRGVTESHLVPLLEYLYFGETSVSQHLVEEFIKLSNDLKVSDLCKNREQATDDTKEAYLLVDSIKTETITTVTDKDEDEEPENNEPTFIGSYQDMSQEKSLKSRNKHDKSSLKFNKLGQCPWCGKQMMATSLGLHIRSLHKKAKLKCDYCSYEATRKDTLKDHLMRHHGIGYKYICDVSGCDFKTTRPSKLSNHKNEIHVPFKGGNINPEIEKANALSNKSDTNTYKCDIPGCEFMVMKSGELMEHKFSKHRG